MVGGQVFHLSILAEAAGLIHGDVGGPVLAETEGLIHGDVGGAVLEEAEGLIYGDVGGAGSRTGGSTGGGTGAEGWKGSDLPPHQEMGQLSVQVIIVLYNVVNMVELCWSS